MLDEAVTAALKYSNDHCNFWPERLDKAVTEALKYSNDRCSFWPQRLGKAVTKVLKHSLTLLAKEARTAVSDTHILKPSLELLAGTWEEVTESWIASEHPLTYRPMGRRRHVVP